MEIFLIVVNVILLVILSVTVFNAWSAPLVKNGPKPRSRPLVSVLIPARNEEHNISRCLSSLQAQDYPRLEILVLDDESDDDTAAVVKRISKQDKRIRLLSGKPLRNGWTGKNWACYQLGQKAKGNILLFTDADNFYESRAISHTVGWMQKLDLSLASAFPQQITISLAEKMIVPVFDMFVYSYLPLWLTYYASQPSLAAANGQWIAITKHAYRILGGHDSVRNQMVEDVEFSRRAKSAALKILTLSGVGEVKGRMYHSWREVWQGFSKNAFGLMSYQTIPFFSLLCTMMCVYIVPYLLIWFRPYFSAALSAIAINMAIRAVLAFKYKQPFWTCVLLHPATILITILIGLNSYKKYRINQVTWKNRSLTFRT